MIFPGFMNIASGDSSATLPQMALFAVVSMLFYATSQIVSSVSEGIIWRKEFEEDCWKKYLISNDLKKQDLVKRNSL